MYNSPHASLSLSLIFHECLGIKIDAVIWGMCQEIIDHYQSLISFVLLLILKSMHLMIFYQGFFSLFLHKWVD